MTTPELPLRIDTSQEAMKVRFEEYQSIYDNTTSLSERRQSINNLFVGINTLFLTAFGYLIINLPLQPWWPSIVFTIVTAPVIAINIIWYRLNHRYKNLINVRIIYLKALEDYLQTQGFAALPITFPRDKHRNPPANVPSSVTLVGIHNFEDDKTGELQRRLGPIFGFSSLEQGIIQVFVITYIGITALVILLNTLQATHIFSALPSIIQPITTPTVTPTP